MAKDTVVGKFPNRIRKYRKARHLQLKQMATLLSLKASTPISDWEAGRRSPTVINLFKLSAILRVPPEFLFKELYDDTRRVIQDLKNRHQIFEKFD